MIQMQLFIEETKEHEIVEGVQRALIEFGGKTGQRILDTFECMEIAEHEIAAWMVKYPKRADQINDAFQYLYPIPTLNVGGDRVVFQVYRWHVQEILQRIADDQKVEGATRAEVLAALAVASTHAPLTQDATAAYYELFCKCQELGDEPLIEGLHQWKPYESYPGAVNELIAWAYKKVEQIRSE